MAREESRAERVGIKAIIRGVINNVAQTRGGGGRGMGLCASTLGVKDFAPSQPGHETPWGEWRHGDQRGIGRAGCRMERDMAEKKGSGEC